MTSAASWARPSTSTFAEHLGRAFGSEAVAAGERAVAIGRDGRRSGPALCAALARGLTSTGLDVVDLGAVTTPMLYYVAATRGKFGCRSGIQVTGSHNPKDYNGFKMVLGGRAIYGDEIQRLRERMQREDYAQGAGRLGNMTILGEYTRRIVNDCRQARRMRIVVDSGNGIPGASAPGILRALGHEVIDLYSRVDGDFPNHHPDPSKLENLADLIKVVHATEAELGLAFDGDGDRLGVVTRDGQVIFPDRQLMLLARDVLARNPGATIIYDVKCSQRLGADIRCGRRRAADVEDRPLADEGQAQGRGRTDRRRDERPHLLQRTLVRLRRCDVHRGAHARDPVAQRRSQRGAQRAADVVQHAGAQRALRRGRAAARDRRAARAGQVRRCARS